MNTQNWVATTRGNATEIYTKFTRFKNDWKDLHNFAIAFTIYLILKIRTFFEIEFLNLWIWTFSIEYLKKKHSRTWSDPLEREHFCKWFCWIIPLPMSQPLSQQNKKLYAQGTKYSCVPIKYAFELVLFFFCFHHHFIVNWVGVLLCVCVVCMTICIITGW